MHSTLFVSHLCGNRTGWCCILMWIGGRNWMQHSSSRKVKHPCNTLDQSNCNSTTTKYTITKNTMSIYSITINSMSIYSITINSNIGITWYIPKILTYEIIWEKSSQALSFMRKRDHVKLHIHANLKSCNTRTSQKVTHPSFTLDKTHSTNTKNIITTNIITINSMSIYSLTINNNICTTSYIPRA